MPNDGANLSNRSEENVLNRILRINTPTGSNIDFQVQPRYILYEQLPSRKADKLNNVKTFIHKIRLRKKLITPVELYEPGMNRGGCNIATRQTNREKNEHRSRIDLKIILFVHRK